MFFDEVVADDFFFFFFVDILEAHEIKKNKKQEREPE